MVIEIVILAMIAAFLGLRLYSVLGRRAEHEEEPIPTRFEQPDRQPGARPAPLQPSAGAQRPVELPGLGGLVEQAIRQIAAADRYFDVQAFLQGARGAYQTILEAFWRGDREELQMLCTPDVYASFAAAIAAREEAGEVLDNRLVRVEEVIVQSAALDGRMARIGVRFTADIAAVTRDRDGNVVAGSLDDAIESRDIWTFARSIDATGPDWLLEETDEA
ncbi:Tim44/TimA family putative adaptor protein [Caenibius tardaugens]|nr:Tim44/TimA family putative adaptor protein [Caenibius tardaugens]AZI36561.1 Tim44 domain-containing protein [Caenibius tardaugens NBRC 16725]